MGNCCGVSESRPPAIRLAPTASPNPKPEPPLPPASTPAPSHVPALEPAPTEGPGTTAAQNMESTQCGLLQKPKELANISAISCANGDSYKFACAWGKSLYLYDANTHNILESFQPHAQGVFKCRFMGSNNSLITSSYDLSLCLWNLENLSAPKQVFTGHEATIRAFCFNPSQTQLASGSRDFRTVLWDISTGKKVAESVLAENSVRAMEWNPASEHTFVQCSEDAKVRVWDTRNLLEVAQTISLPDEYFATACALDATGVKLVTGHYGTEQAGCGVYLWDLREAEEGKSTWSYLGHKNEVVQALVFTHQKAGKEIVVTASKDGTVKTISLLEGQMIDSYLDASRLPLVGIASFAQCDCPLLVAGLSKSSDAKIVLLRLCIQIGSVII